MGAGIAAGILSGLNTLGQNQQAQQQQQIEASKLGEAKLRGQLFTQMINSPEWKGMKPIDQWRALQDPSVWQQQQGYVQQADQLDAIGNDPSVSPRVKAVFRAASTAARAGRDPKPIIEYAKMAGVFGPSELDKLTQSVDALTKLPGMMGGMNTGAAPAPPGPGAVRGTQGGKTGYSYKGMFYTDDELKNATTAGP